MSISVIMGLQWGDEGKGKCVDALAQHYDVIARYQGGPNAGHTLHLGDSSLVLHQIPSGILHPHTCNLLGNSVVLDPVVLCQELDALVTIAPNLKRRVVLSQDAHLILPIHKAIEQAEETYRGQQRIGSTQRGIGPCYADKYARRGLRLVDFVNPKAAQIQYQNLCKWHERCLGNSLDYRTQERVFFDAIEKLRDYKWVNGILFVQQALAANKRLLAEGAQGALLDLEQGTYPYVTSSHASVGGACISLGVPSVDKVYGVAKAYCTRVGEGPFPSEATPKEAEQLRQHGKEYGATTGRQRRCGWLDLVALRYAIQRNGVQQLILTKLDILSHFEQVHLCTNYTYQNKQIEYSPDLLDTLTCEWTTLPSWPHNTNYANERHWHTHLRNFIAYIEKHIQIPISTISYGPQRTDLLTRRQADTRSVKQHQAGARDHLRQAGARDHLRQAGARDYLKEWTNKPVDQE